VEYVFLPDSSSGGMPNHLEEAEDKRIRSPKIWTWARSSGVPMCLEKWLDSCTKHRESMGEFDHPVDGLGVLCSEPDL